MLIFGSIKLLPFAAIRVLRFSKRLFSQSVFTGTIQWQTVTSKVTSEALIMQLNYITSLHFKHDWEQILKPQMCASILVMYKGLTINMIYQN
jgi:hypothetical protein